MYAVVGTNRTLSQRVKPIIIAGLLALSLMAGAGASANPVGAATPQAGQASIQPVVDSGIVDTGDLAAKPTSSNGKGKGKQTKTHCYIIESAYEWELITGYKADPDFVGGMYCPKV